MTRLDSKYLSSYPIDSIPFYVYGSEQLHIDHALLASPNIQLNSDRITLKNLTQMDGSPLSSELNFDATVDASEAELGPSAGVGSPYVLHFVDFPEVAMQPFPADTDIAGDTNFFFKPNGEYNIVIAKDVDMIEAVAKGVVQLSDYIFIDTDMLNSNPTLDEQGESCHFC